MRYQDWCKILQCTYKEIIYILLLLFLLYFSNMINVGALDSHTLEHQEYSDRIKLYSQRLQQQWNNIQHPGFVQKGLISQ